MFATIQDLDLARGVISVSRTAMPSEVFVWAMITLARADPYPQDLLHVRSIDLFHGFCFVHQSWVDLPTTLDILSEKKN